MVDWNKPYREERSKWRRIKDRFVAPSEGVTNGDSHDHSGGDGAQINHTTLSTIGTNTHAQIDTHIADTNDPHNVTWAQVDKTTSSIADITTKSHTALTDIGTNTHAQIDTHLAAASPHSNHAIVGTFTDATASRALNTTYTNSDASRSILVVATVRCAISLAGGNAYVQAKSDSSTPPTTVVSGLVGIEAGLLSEDNSFTISFLIAPSMKYRIDASATNGTCVLGKWFEVTL
mgnify:FL=1